MSRIKAMHIWKDFDTFYGLTQRLLVLAKNIDYDKFELNICVFKYKGSSFGQEFERLGGTIHNLNVLWKYNPFTIWKLYKFLKEQKPHIVQTYCLKTNLFGGIAAKLAGVPVIIGTELTLKDQGGSTFIKRVRDFFLYPLDAQLIRIWDKMVFSSETVKNEWKNRKHAQKFKVIYPPFDLDKFSAYKKSRLRSSQPKRKTPIIGIVARLSEERGHKYLIDALPTVIEAFPEVKLLIVGTGYLEKKLKEYVKSFQLEDHIIFTGHSENVYEMLEHMDVFVLPSRSEGLAIVLLEAMVMGLPVVASGVGGIPEVVTDGQTGILVPPKNPSALAEAIVYLLSSPEQARRMGLRGKEKVFREFHPSKFVKEHEELYEDLSHRKNIPV